MITILDFLRQGFDVLESLPKDDLDILFDNIKQYRINPNRGDNTTQLNQLVAETANFYYQVGTKIAQTQAVQDRLELQLNQRLYTVAKDKKIKNTYNNRKEIETYAMEDPEYLKLLQKIKECDSMVSFLKNTHTALFMEHYSLRNQSEPSNNVHLKINH